MVADSRSRTVTPPSVCLTQDLGIGVLSPAIGESLSARYAGRCRGAEVAAATGADFASDTDAGYSYRVFLRHYCIHLAGPDPSTAQPAFPATPGLLAVSTTTSASIFGDGGSGWSPASGPGW